jgi:hypothetical protein
MNSAIASKPVSGTTAVEKGRAAATVEQELSAYVYTCTIQATQAGNANFAAAARRPRYRL